MLSADACHLSLSEMLLQCFPAGLAQAYSWTSLLWSNTVARLQLLNGYPSLCFALFLSFALSLFITLPCYLSFYFCLSLFLPLYFLHICSYFLACILSCLSLRLPSSLRPYTSLSHTLVATLKTVVTMVTAMCCGNVKDLNPPRITSLFKT